MKGQISKIINGRVITPSGCLKQGNVIVKDGRIIEVSSQNQEIAGATIIDAEGNYVAPGCIDIHVHGAAGHDFMEATQDAFSVIAEAHAKYGTTSMLATLAVSSPETICKAIDVCENRKESPHSGANILGLHLEGNYLNMQMKGAQNPVYISDPNVQEYQMLLNSTECIKRWSAAPELPGALEFAQYATQKGVLVALAHTTADYPQVKAGFQAGFTHATHFYNAMTGVHKDREYKREGTIEAVYLTDGMSVEVIADGIHVPPAILKMIYKFKGPEYIALVTDAMSAAACQGAVNVFDPRTIIEDGVCKMADRSALAGSIATADRLIRTMVQLADIPLSDAVRMASETPARILKIDHNKGTIEKGKDADIIIFDDDIQIKQVFVGGNRI